MEANAPTPRGDMISPKPEPLSVTERAGSRTRSASRPGERHLQRVGRDLAERFELLEANLDIPVARTGTVPRTGLVNRLRAASVSVVTVVAPGGYGKTTVLGQWARRDVRPFAWVTVEDEDNDPVVLLRYVTAALDGVEPVDVRLVDALMPPRPSVRSVAARRLTAALSSAGRPLVLVLDDVHLLRSRDSAEAVAALAEHVPSGSTLVLAGRDLPALPIARLRAAGRVHEVGVEELALSPREAKLLLREAGLELPDEDVAQMAHRTEGWAAGLSLAALALEDQGETSVGAAGFSGEDRFVADYFRFEHLRHLDPCDVRFLTRTSVLSRMSGPLCDAVLETSGSSDTLERLAGSNLFVVPLDRRREWHRYHRLFRDLLRNELERREPGLAPLLNQRAAVWCEGNGAAEDAIHYADAAGDPGSVARLVTAVALPPSVGGPVATVERWFTRFDREQLGRYPALAVLGGWFHAFRGRPAEAESWLHTAELGRFDGPLPDGSESIEPWLAVLRAAMCPDGGERMLSDAEVAVDQLAPESQWRPIALLLEGVAHLVLGDLERADLCLGNAADLAERMDATDIRILALGERALLAAGRGDHAAAKAYGLEARAVVDESAPDNRARSLIELVVSARRELRGGSWERARAELEKAGRLRSELTHAVPWYSVQINLELARAHASLLDDAAAWTLLSDAEEILRRCPGLGVLGRDLEEFRSQLSSAERPDGRAASVLTAAELRLLPLLSTHLSFREIGEHLHISRNTVKTQAIAVYRKLGVSSRSDAIERAAALGLVETVAARLLDASPVRDDAEAAARR
jgi:LuxR family maltose regulon positive regulatory protein